MMSESTRIEQTFTRLLIALTISFAVWQAGMIFGMVADMAAADPWLRAWKTPVVAVGMLGWAAWSYAMIRLTVLQHRLRSRPALAMALNDERVASNRRLAFAIGFWSTMIFAGLLTVATSFVTFPAVLAANATIAVGVLSVCTAYLALGREPSDG